MSTGLPLRQSLRSISVRWRYILSINNLTAHYDSQFCIHFHFGSLIHFWTLTTIFRSYTCAYFTIVKCLFRSRSIDKCTLHSLHNVCWITVSLYTKSHIHIGCTWIYSLGSLLIYDYIQYFLQQTRIWKKKKKSSRQLV